MGYFSFVMAVLFIGLAVLAAPRLSAQPAERLLPAFSSESLHLVLALIGTTVVPYNLFLHATAARRRWQGESVAEALQGTRRESFLAIVIGALADGDDPTPGYFVVLAALAAAGALVYRWLPNRDEGSDPSLPG